MTMAVNYLWANKWCFFTPGKTERLLSKKNNKIKEKGKKRVKRKIILPLGASGDEGMSWFGLQEDFKQSQKVLVARVDCPQGSNLRYGDEEWFPKTGRYSPNAMQSTNSTALLGGVIPVLGSFVGGIWSNRIREIWVTYILQPLCNYLTSLELPTSGHLY